MSKGCYQVRVLMLKAKSGEKRLSPDMYIYIYIIWKKPPISKTNRKAYNFESRDHKNASPRITVQNFVEILGGIFS